MQTVLHRPVGGCPLPVGGSACLVAADDRERAVCVVYLPAAVPAATHRVAAKQLLQTAQSAPGYLSGEWLAPPFGAESLLLIRFRTQQHLLDWQQSPTAATAWRDLQQQANPLVSGDGSGSVPRPRPLAEPARWKTALLTAIGLYPVVLFLFPAFTLVLNDLPGWLQKLILVGLTVPAMQ